MIHRIEETTSTNDDARDAKYRHGDIVWAERQTAGRGQRGHKWSSAEGLNLTFSLVLEPRFLPAGEQFLLNEAVALALTDTFAQFGIAARIKWTNDIYAGDKKLVGILIEHSYSGQTLARTTRQARPVSAAPAELAADAAAVSRRLSPHWFSFCPSFILFRVQLPQAI